LYFEALDDAAFFAANSLVPGHFVLARQFNVHLLGPIQAGIMRAEGRVDPARRGCGLRLVGVAGGCRRALRRGICDG
jgi:acyl-coenzyme A thioesterase PaaI-like protein